jgi:succinoglycan biosynthesis transport protein ExoP
MLHVNKRPQLSDPEAQKPSRPILDAVTGSYRIIRRQLPIVIVVFLCCVALGLLYLFTASPKFTATGTMLLDTRKLQVMEQQSVLGELQVDAATVQTQVEVLKSENISLAVIRKLKLMEDPEFIGEGGGLLSTIIGFITGREDEPPPTEFELEKRALEKFEAQRTVTRLGLTYVMEVGFTSLNADKSAKIVNTLVEAYVAEQLDAKYQAARRAGLWLLARINELRANATVAERAVVDFKEKHHIVDAGGKLINEQQLAEVNSQLIIARAATAEAKARLDRIRTVMAQDIVDASVTDALKSEVIIKLRGQYLDLAQREAIFSQKYGSNHLATVNLRNQMREFKRSINDEMRKIAESYESDYQIARARAESLEKSLANVVTQSQLTGQAQVQLKELESNKESARAIYDNFLHRYMEAVQQQDAIPISETRLISPATPPLKKSSPKTLLTLLIAIAAGGTLSFAVAYLREASDGVLRTTEQVEHNLHVNCLAMVPAIKTPGAPRPEKNDADSGTVGVNPPPADPVLLRYVVDAPFSRFAEALRAIKIAADINGALKSHKTIGFTSTLPNEGKSTLAANLAQLIADAGSNAILVDADLRSPTLSRSFCPDAPGLIDAVLGTSSLESVIVTLPASRLHFLPAGATAKLPHTNEILASGALKNVMDVLRSRYDYVIVDLSPVAPIVDVRATGHIIDSYVYVVEWGRTKIEIIERALTEAQTIYDQMLGVVLNRVDMSVQGRYERYHGNHYYRKYYAKYGYVE